MGGNKIREFEYQIAQAVERGCCRFEWVVLDWNQSAIDFYQELGAEAMEGWQLFRISGEKLKNLAMKR